MTDVSPYRGSEISGRLSRWLEELRQRQNTLGVLRYQGSDVAVAESQGLGVRRTTGTTTLLDWEQSDGTLEARLISQAAGNFEFQHHLTTRGFTFENTEDGVTMAQMFPGGPYLAVYPTSIGLAARFGRTSTQHLRIWGDSGGHWMQTMSPTTNTKSLIFRVTTDDVGSAGTSEPYIYFRGRSNTNIASVSDTQGLLANKYFGLVHAGELTISSGSVTPTGSNHTIDTEGNAASDDLDTIVDDGSVATGTLLLLRAAADARTVVVKDGTGNLRLAGDFSLTHTQDCLLLMHVGTSWIEVSRSDNAA